MTLDKIISYRVGTSKRYIGVVDVPVTITVGIGHIVGFRKVYHMCPANGYAAQLNEYNMYGIKTLIKIKHKGHVQAG